MLLESLLAYAHIVAILTLVVFLSSEAALCRAEWLNAAVVRRLARVDAIYMGAAAVVLATGVARTWWGIKGTAWYWHQPLLHLKLTLFVLIGIMAIQSSQALRRWARQLDADGSLPAEAEVRRVRRLVMVQAHLLVLVPLAATLLARGVLARA